MFSINLNFSLFCENVGVMPLRRNGGGPSAKTGRIGWDHFYPAAAQWETSIDVDLYPTIQLSVRLHPCHMDGGMGKRPKGANLVIPEILVILVNLLNMANLVNLAILVIKSKVAVSLTVPTKMTKGRYLTATLDLIYLGIELTGQLNISNENRDLTTFWNLCAPYWIYSLKYWTWN